jgi:hypothetical protein
MHVCLKLTLYGELLTMLVLLMYAGQSEEGERRWQ